MQIPSAESLIFTPVTTYSYLPVYELSIYPAVCKWQ